MIESSGGFGDISELYTEDHKFGNNCKKPHILLIPIVIGSQVAFYYQIWYNYIL